MRQKQKVGNENEMVGLLKKGQARNQHWCYPSTVESLPPLKENQQCLILVCQTATQTPHTHTDRNYAECVMKQIIGMTLPIAYLPLEDNSTSLQHANEQDRTCAMDMQHLC